MKRVPKLSLIALCCFMTYPALSENILNTTNSSQRASSNNTDVADYLLNLGAYLGFKLDTNSPPIPPEEYTAAIIDKSITIIAQQYLYNTLLGAIPVNSLTQAASQLIPTSAQSAQLINSMANTTFSGYGSSGSAQQPNGISVSTLLDQSIAQGSGQGQYLSDPVNQSVFDILGTPDPSYCMNNDGSAWLKKGSCNLLYQSKVSSNVIGPLPSPSLFFTYPYVQSFLGQLNTNSLLAPMMYTTQSNNDNHTSSASNKQQTGLTAQNQAQTANNFIRYVSGLVAPTPLPKYKDYSDLYAQANKNINADPPDIQQMEAQTKLTSYFNHLRVYAAQSSVGLSNLYYILSKRMPQNQSTNNDPSKNTSQALSEFNMATWRVFNPNAPISPDGKTSTQWVEQLNNASSATIQKEIAVLLAEINYQMYLDRQVQERLLLTNSVMLLQNLKASEPSSDFTSSGSDAGNVEE